MDCRMKFAVLLTVYNRKNVTLEGLKTLYRSIDVLDENYCFEIYMTDDGCTDGTVDTIKNMFPQVHIVRGDGNLYWGGGMNLAWKTAFHNKKYDGFIWFNDDSILYKSAMKELLKPYMEMPYPVIVVGAFRSKLTGNSTYGGKLKDTDNFLKPNGTYQELELMNGNLVFIPYEIMKEIGIIDCSFRHGIGDYDYGLRAIKSGFKLLLTPSYVGTCERHDKIIKKCFNSQYSFFYRLKFLYSPLNSPIAIFIYQYRYYGFCNALKLFVALHFYTFFPSIYVLRLKNKQNG